LDVGDTSGKEAYTDNSFTTAYASGSRIAAAVDLTTGSCTGGEVDTASVSLNTAYVDDLSNTAFVTTAAGSRIARSWLRTFFVVLSLCFARAPYAARPQMTAAITAMIAVDIELDPPSLLLLLAARTAGADVVTVAVPVVGGRDGTSDKGAKVVGCRIGGVVGSKVGAAVGCTVSATVGCTVGATVGTVDGAPVGKVVGALVGG
jgi:hypothetical protein